LDAVNKLKEGKMKREIIVGFAFFVFSLGFVLAAQGSGNGSGQGDNQIIGGDTDENGCLGPAGYSWNETEQACVREWETGEERYQDKEQERQQERIQSGEHVSEEGQRFMLQVESNNRVRVESGGFNAGCDCNMTQETVQNKTKLRVHLSNGVNAEIKIMPDVAAQKALERLRLKVCSEENECKIELKEVGSGQEIKLAYELKTQRRAKVLGIFGAKMEVKAQVEAENGDIIKVDKPWWAFLASEPQE